MPIPVSTTDSDTVLSRPRLAEIVTLPWCVNFNALLNRFRTICFTFWRSVDSVRGFAGADVEAAVVAEEAAALLTQFDRRVRHYEVAVKDDV